MGRERDITDIVILGGGYVSVWAYRSMVKRLRSELRSGTVKVTVISASKHHGFHGWTGEVLAGKVRYERTRTPLDQLMPQATIVHGWVTGVDHDARDVLVERNGTTQRIHYDQLLVGVGTSDATSRISGLASSGFTVKTDEALLATRDQLRTVVAEANATDDRRDQRRLLTFVVAGGGFAGVEMTAAIAELLEALGNDRALPSGVVPRVVLVHRGDALLPSLRPRFRRLADYATRQLEGYGVDIELGIGLRRVTPTGAVLSDGTVISAATVVSTIGQQQTALPGLESAERDSSRRIVVDHYLRTSIKGVWAGGDAAAVAHPVTGQTCPPNALWALKHGTRVGDNIARAVRARRLRRFRFLGLGQAASFGIGKGAAELYGVQLTGWLGWIARWSFFHYFMPSRRAALTTMREWLAPRDLAVPTPADVAVGVADAA